ncbi:MAG: TolC family protein [Dysgonamonadaceae bacterium]|jgi:outer membrane protein TolC|nr:TolC family protein [Dysgonamonadaceae bacterium]
MKKINKNILLLLSMFLFSVPELGSRTILEQIEQNNTVLSALRRQADVDKIGNKTGIYFENPMIEYHYLWGNRSETGNRTDFAVGQNFDFPAAYYYRKRVSNAQNRQVDLKYRIERKNILLEARRLCIELTYQNALYQALTEKMRLAGQIAKAYEEKLNMGETNRLDYNRAMLNFSSVQKEFNSCKTNREYLSDELTRLNGGIAIPYDVSSFEPVIINPDFDAFYSELKDKNLSLVYLQQEISLSIENEKLRRSLNLPKFSAGYMSEKVLTEHFQGITVGISVPLWENKNVIKQAKAQTQANRMLAEDTRLRDYNEAAALHKKTMNLSQIIENYRKNVLPMDYIELLKKALDVGEISIIDYILEADLYLDTAKDMLETERELNLTIAELMQWEL